jgi:hypothetical protein
MSESPRDHEPTWELSRFRAAYEQDDNIWWATTCGHHLNLFDAACEEADALRAERDAARGTAVTLEQECERLRAELDVCRTWQAKRVVAISQDPMCVKWMRQSEQLGAENDALRAALDAVRRDIRDLAELYLYDGDTDQPVNDSYGALICFADALTAAAGVPEPTEEQR